MVNIPIVLWFRNPYRFHAFENKVGPENEVRAVIQVGPRNHGAFFFTGGRTIWKKQTHV